MFIISMAYSSLNAFLIVQNTFSQDRALAMQDLVGLANRRGAVMLFEMMVFMQFLSNVWKSECEVTPALSDPVFSAGCQNGFFGMTVQG